MLTLYFYAHLIKKEKPFLKSGYLPHDYKTQQFEAVYEATFIIFSLIFCAVSESTLLERRTFTSLP